MTPVLAMTVVREAEIAAFIPEKFYTVAIEFAGGGATVPLTGFGNLLAKGVREAVDQHGLIGAFMGGFTASAVGISAAIFFGLLAALCFKSGSKINET